MFQYATPESAGISSKAIMRYVRFLEDRGMATHDILIARGNQIIYENYWAPFHENFLHRMYSVTKSFVSLAIGCLEEEGKICLDDPIIRYFPEEAACQTDTNFLNQTIRDMLMMSTAKNGRNWFAARPEDRVRFYFDNDREESRIPGTIFEYDSTGSFVLGSLVERVTGKPFLDYLRERFLDEIGFSKEATCLRCPGGHSWSDSAILCTPLDLLKTARFVMNGGSHQGKQLMSRSYIAKATSKQIDNNVSCQTDIQSQGYGYQFWMGYGKSFFFNGMGCQFALCIPEQDLILIYNGDNQGNSMAANWVLDTFFEQIAWTASNTALPEDPDALAELKAYSGTRKLMAARGETSSEVQKTADGVWYAMQPNPMGITRMRVVFNQGGGFLEYENAQGPKSIAFGLGENRFCPFPQEGYSDQVGSVRTKGHYYHCAASGAWVEARKLFIRVQIIDKYFGNLNITIGFAAKGIGVHMNKVAEDFLEEYQGFAAGFPEA